MDKKRNQPTRPNATTAARIRQERHLHHETQEMLAQAVGFEKQAAHRWENPEAKYRTRDEVLLKLARHWNVMPEYLAGDTDIKDPVLFYAQEEAALDAAADEYFHERQAERVRMENLFHKCGFQYRDSSEYGPFDFVGVGIGHLDKPEMEFAAVTGRTYQLIDLRTPSRPPAYFNGAELEALIEGLHSTIAFECFKQCEKCKKEGSPHGNG